MSKGRGKGSAKGSQKSVAKRRTFNPPDGPGHAKRESKAFQQHDVERRLGSFEGTGNHARTGNRGHQ